MPPRTIDLSILKSVFGGEGLASIEGKACFVEGALPGEVVTAEVTQEKKNFLRARIVKVLQRSTQRVEPPCRYVGRCGGCQYQHVSYPGELELKQAQIHEIFSGFDRTVIRSIRPAASEFGYRNSVTLHPLTGRNKKAEPIGFVGKDNLSVIPVSGCLIADASLAPVFSLKTHPKHPSDRITFKLSETGEIVSDRDDRYFRVRIGDRSVIAHARGFFQNNLAVTTALASQVSEWVAASAPDAFFDLYAGVGTFSLLSASSVPRIVCIEDGRENLEAMRMNRDERGLASLEIVPGRVEVAFPRLWKEEAGRHEKKVLFFDPPRQGLSPSLSRFLSDIAGIEAMIYVSCDMPTLARDLKTIVSGGRYRVADLIPFDMFPKTKHIEAVVRVLPVSI